MLDWEASGDHRPIGFFTTSLGQLTGGCATACPASALLLHCHGADRVAAVSFSASICALTKLLSIAGPGKLAQIQLRHPQLGKAKAVGTLLLQVHPPPRAPGTNTSAGVVFCTS